MINSRMKGRRAEKEVKAMMELAGYKVYLVPMPKRYNKENDMYHCWDLLATRGEYWKFIQVKSNRKPSRQYIRKLNIFAEEHANPFMAFEIWIRHDGRPPHKRWDEIILGGVL